MFNQNYLNQYIGIFLTEKCSCSFGNIKGIMSLKTYFMLIPFIPMGSIVTLLPYEILDSKLHWFG